MTHRTGWISTVYGEDRWHRTQMAANQRVAAAYNGMCCPPDGVWCCVTGNQAHDCECSQCSRELGVEGKEKAMPQADWDNGDECPRCGRTLTPREVEFEDARDCPRCGLENHPVFAELDRLCGGAEGKGES